MPFYPSTDATDLPNLSGCITRENDYYSAHGGSADIWTGMWCNGTGYRKVHFVRLRFASLPIDIIKGCHQSSSVGWREWTQPGKIEQGTLTPLKRFVTSLTPYRSGCIRRFWCGECSNTTISSPSLASRSTLDPTTQWAWFARG